MFEYINPGFYILSGILIVGSLGLSYASKMKVDENIEYFKQNLPLECTDGLKTYIVSKDRKWEIVKEDSFTKNDLVIRADKCSLNKEIKKW